MDAGEVAKHYNARPIENLRSRRNSPIIRLRQFNNWLKSVLIDLHTRPGNAALDLCCGKGGDLHKWLTVGCTTYVGCDIARVSVGVAADRWNESLKKNNSSPTFRPILRTGDCFEVRIADHIPPHVEFDIVSCQFSMHYAFDSERRVRRLLENVTDRLKPGGFFVGTTIDANVVIRKIRAITDMEISSSVYRIRFDDRHADKKFRRDAGPYGIRYNFTLDQSVEDCPEFLVHFPSFVEVAREFDLELVMLCNFHDFFTEFSSPQYPTYRDKIFRMDVLDEHGSISPDEWDAIYLYTAFAFKKSGKLSESAGIDRDADRDWVPIDKGEITAMASDKT